MFSSADALRRWLGMFCLAVAAGLLIWGQTILKPYLEGVVFLVYWFGCFAFTMATIGIALLDVWAVRRRSRQERRELLARTLQEVQTQERPPGPGGGPEANGPNQPAANE